MPKMLRFSNSFYILTKQVFVFIVIIVVSSCVVQEEIQIGTFVPSEIKPDTSINNVVLVNHALFNGTYPQSSFYKDSLYTMAYFDGLSDILSNSVQYKLVDAPVQYLKKSMNEQFKKLTLEELNVLALKTDADAAVVLENYQTTYTDPIKLIFDENYGYYGSLVIENTSLWRVYKLKTGEKIDEYLLCDTLFFDAAGNTFEEAYSNFPKIDNAISQTCYILGQKYGKRIANTWQIEKRTLFNCEKPDFNEASKLAKNGQWEKALLLWKKYINHKNRRLASLACYNIAVACEVMDNIDAALDWAAKSYFTYPNVWATKYISVLEKRNAFIIQINSSDKK